MLKDLLNTTKPKSNHPKTFKHNGTTLTDPKLIAQEFNDFFTNIGPTLASKIQDAHIVPN